MVFSLCFISWWKLLLESWNLELVQLFLTNWSADWFARHAWCSPSVLHISRWQMLAWGSWNFELVQLFFINWIAHCFARHAWCFVMKIVAWELEFGACAIVLDKLKCRLICSARMVFTVCFKYFVMANACLRQLEFWACANINHLNTSLSFLTDVTSDKIIVKTYF